MFDQAFVNTQAQMRRPFTLAASIVLQTALVATMLIMPLLHVPKLELPGKFQLTLPVELVSLQEKPKPVQQTPAAQTHTVSTRPVFRPTSIPVPTRVPQGITTLDAPDIPISGMPGLSTGSAMLPGLGEIHAAPPPVGREPIPTKPPASAPIHVSGGVQAGNLIFAPKPVYPRIAVMAHMQGTVHIQAIIERDGSIGNLKVLGGPPLLQTAALDAVKQWRYKPTLLNGQPVEVVTEIDVNFALN
jgi:periplasmic protein TonB